MPKYLLLFDIDGTLIRAGGAGSKALNRVFEDHFQIPNACQSIRLDGRTDRAIVREMINFFSPPMTLSIEETIDLILQQYLENLEHEIAANHLYTVLPGIPEILQIFSQRDDVFLALATGNLKRGAEIKLKRGNLFHYFRCGGFGCDSEIRPTLVAEGIQRANGMVAKPFSPDHTFVIGDTEFDIDAGKKVGAKTIAVATGSHDMALLAKYKPDFIFENFSDRERFLRIFS